MSRYKTSLSLLYIVITAPVATTRRKHTTGPAIFTMHEPQRKMVLVSILIIGILTVLLTTQLELDSSSEVMSAHTQNAGSSLPETTNRGTNKDMSKEASKDKEMKEEGTAAGVPPRLLRVIGDTHAKRLKTGDELLQAANHPLNFLDNFTRPYGNPTLALETLQSNLRTEGFGSIPNLLSKEVASALRKYLLSLLNEEGVGWAHNEGEDLRTDTLGRVMHGLPKKYYEPLEKIMTDANFMKYLSALMPCKEMEHQKFRMTQMFITVNDRIRWHVDYPNQPPMEEGKTTMYGPDFCQIKTIFYLQDHSDEGPGNPSALMVVPRTHLAEPKWYKCGGKNCSIARKQMVPSAEYTSVNLKPSLGEVLVMDARLLHAAADYTLTLPTVPQPTPRKNKYRVFLQFLWGIDNNKLTDAMQRKKDKNLSTKHFKQKLFP
eukprot:TRINITY_DN10291_c0_g1_i1.p1 TRINITY_DN10291_c0_g1~~TRINITY_DN10291_c0_g1_i1.p1  ORF type:complete len:432 (+),score=60.11 TRINITY_DN10291_c0_g1_i1:1185-2480(+)